MRRLTYKCPRGILVESSFEYDLLNGVCYQDCIDKLGQLEDIEEEFGIDLVIFEKIKEQDFIYGRYKNEIRKFTANHFTFDNILAYTKLGVNSWMIKVKFPFNQYGKTWALTKEELEK